MSKPTAAIQKDIEKIYAKKRRLIFTEENLKSLTSGKAMKTLEHLSPNTGMELQKAKASLIDDYGQSISKLKSEITLLETGVLRWMSEHGWQDGEFQEIMIAHPDNRNRSVSIMIGLKNDRLVLEG